MARPGPQPKDVKHGHGGAGWIDVPNVPYDGPGSQRDLPSPGGGMQWFPQVEAWWEIVRVMPHCRLWEASDWMFAIMTAYQWQNWWSEYYGGTVHTTASTEIRRREDQMGFTMEARRKLGIRYVDPKDLGRAGEAPEQQAAGATPITAARSRRERLAG